MILFNFERKIVLKPDYIQNSLYDLKNQIKEPDFV